MIPASVDDHYLLARTIYGEARGESFEGKVAVAWVVVNRLNADSARLDRLYGNDIGDICTKPLQFSCWHWKDPNYKLLQAAKLDTDPAFRACLGAACSVLAEAVPDPTSGATHYYAASLKTPPAWAKGKEPCATIGKHLFFNDIEEDR
jgi:hypothetical protein